MNLKNGHIRKEQARSDEAFENIIPELFHAQKLNIADSQPSFFNALSYLLSMSTSELTENATDLLVRSFKKWQKLFEHYEKTLQNPSIPCTFSYRGRTELSNENSGLEDYPRASKVNEKFEIHLDL